MLRWVWYVVWVKGERKGGVTEKPYYNDRRCHSVAGVCCDVTM